MRPEELGCTLRKMYDDAPKDEKTTMVHLFGIRYANEIHDCGGSVNEIIRLSGLYKSYRTEVQKGVKLARYVVPRAG